MSIIDKIKISLINLLAATIISIAFFMISSLTLLTSWLVFLFFMIKTAFYDVFKQI